MAAAHEQYVDVFGTAEEGIVFESARFSFEYAPAGIQTNHEQQDHHNRTQNLFKLVCHEHLFPLFRLCRLPQQYREEKHKYVFFDAFFCALPTGRATQLSISKTENR